MSKLPKDPLIDEIILPIELNVGNEVDLTATSLIFSTIKKLISQIVQVVKEPKRLLPAMILATSWLVLIILPILNINPFFVKFLSWITFANGGVGGNILNKVAGVLGKGIFAYLITLIISDRQVFSKINSGVKVFYNNLKNIKEPIMIIGIVLALILYNLIVNDMILINSMAAIVLMITSFKTMIGNGIIKQILGRSFYVLNQKGPKGVTMLMAGVTLGFGLSLPLSVIGFNNSGYVGGILLMILAITIKLITSSKHKGAKV